MFNISQLAGTSVPFILSPPISTLAFLVKKSTISPLQDNHQGVSFYSTLVANPSTGKTLAMNVIQNPILEIEAFRKVSPDDSPITNVASVEGLLEYLSTINCMIGMYFRLYKNH